MERVEHELDQMNSPTINHLLESETVEGSLADADAALETDAGFMRENVQLLSVAAVLLAVAIVVIAILLNRGGDQSLFEG